MQFIKKNYGIIIGVVCILGFAIYLFIDAKKLREYQKTLPFHRSYVNIKIYTKNIQNGKNALRKLENLYLTYEKKIARTETEVQGVFYIANNKEKKSSIEIDKTLYHLLKEGENIKKKSQNKIDINSYAVQNLWNQKLKQKEVPNKEEIEKEMEKKSIQFLSENQIQNDHAQVCMDGIIDGFVTKKAQEILKKYNISMYIINTDGIIVSGKSYRDHKYQIALEDTFAKTYYNFIELESEVLATKTLGEITFQKDDKIYHNRIDPSKGEPSFYHRGVNVIAKDSIFADFLSETLFHMSLEEGKAFLKQYPNVPVLWYSMDGEVSYTDTMQKYLLEIER